MNRIRHASIIGMASAALLLLVACTQDPAADRVPPAQTEGRTARLEASGSRFKVTATHAFASPAVAEHQAGQAAPVGQPAVLKSEAVVMQAGHLAAAKVAALVKGDAFDSFVAQLRNEAAADPLASDHTDAQRRVLEERLGDTGPLQAFACGLAICAGTVGRGDDPAAFERFTDAFLQDGPPGANLLYHRFDRGGGDFEDRFVITTDGQGGGVLFPGGASRP